MVVFNEYILLILKQKIFFFHLFFNFIQQSFMDNGLREKYTWEDKEYKWDRRNTAILWKMHYFHE